jgi:hypothetical protein
MIPPQLKPAPPFPIPAPQSPPFQLFDLSVASNFLFKTRLPTAEGPVDLFFGCGLKAPVDVDWGAVEPLFASREKSAEGESLFLFFAAEEGVMLRFYRVADFYLWSDTIMCHLVDQAYDYMVEIYFLGTVLACWFELQGVAALHAAASVVNGEAVAFLSSNKGGKSSLAAALMQRGYPLLTDDILLVEAQDGRAVARSGYPQMRMWREQAEVIFGRSEAFTRVHPGLDKRRIPIDFNKPGSFESGRFPLVRCYIPERYSPEGGQSEIRITAVPPVEAVLTLAGYSFLLWLVDALGLQPGRLKLFSRLVPGVSIRRLSYPSGVEHLTAVCHAVAADS